MRVLPDQNDLKLKRAVAMLLAGCLLSLLVVRDSPAIALPDTAPARRFTEILALVNAGDRPAITEYAKRSFTPGMLLPDADSIVDFLMSQYEVTGGYDVRRVMQSSKEQITVLARADAFSGSVCLSRNGKMLLSRAWGEADREADVSGRIV